MMGPGKNQGQRKKMLKSKRWRLKISPAEHNDRPKLELSRAWEPLCRHCILSFGEREGS